jgi:hypothetical protein
LLIILETIASQQFGDKYKYWSGLTSVNYKENIKRSQLLSSILENKIIETESAYLKILTFKTHLRTILYKQMACPD